MLSDFCHALWDTRIECDAVSSDGYEVCNLISRDKEKKQKGFLAERFVKPVVSVLISFPFPVDVFAVNVNPRVGAQKTRGFEVFAASLKSRSVHTMTPTDNCANNQEFTKSVNHVKASNGGKYGEEITTFHCYEYELNMNNVKEEFNNCFVQILRVQIPEGNIGHFVNPCFPAQHEHHCDSTILKSISANVQKCTLQQGHFLRRISHLVLRITQVHKSSVPCIGALEVFARPTQNCGKFVANYATIVNSRLEQEKQNACSSLFSKVSSVTTDSLGSKPEHVIQTTVMNDCIPEDFIDPITLNIMTLPVLLPSGTTIDQTTLDRHINCEKNWGRLPSDPFTGLPLGTKVVPNAALKCRIDKFLLSSDVCVSNLGRTVGSISDQISTTKLKLDNVKRTIRKKTPFRSNNDIIQPLKKQKTAVNQSSNLHVSGSLDLALEKALSVRNQPIVQNQNVSMSSLISTSKLNESETATSDVTEQKANLDQPSDAGCPHQSTTLFQLPCHHIVCRGCLTRATETNHQCPNCKNTFDKRNVVRVHSRYIQG